MKSAALRSPTGGEVASGVLRGLIASLLVILLGWCFGVREMLNIWVFTGAALNTFVFSSIAVSTAMLARSHADQGMLSTFVITPMAFLCGTFFPVERYPDWIGSIISLLPLTHATRLLRNAALARPVPVGSCLYLAVFGTVCFIAALLVVRRSKN